MRVFPAERRGKSSTIVTAGSRVVGQDNSRCPFRRSQVAGLPVNRHALPRRRGSPQRAGTGVVVPDFGGQLDSSAQVLGSLVAFKLRLDVAAILIFWVSCSLVCTFNSLRMAKIVEQTIKRRGVYWIRKAHIRDEFVRQKICFVEGFSL